MVKSEDIVIQNVTSPWHTSEARRKAEIFSETIGFSSSIVNEIALVVTELSTNLIKHAGGGQIIMRRVQRDDVGGIKVEAIDRGPGIIDVERAIVDGFSTAESLGYGLGTINRLMDSLDIISPVDDRGGAHISCIRWIRENRNAQTTCPLDAGGASRAHPHMEVNGDAFLIKKWGEFLLVSIIDGLGHGQFAHKASVSALNYIEKHYDQPLSDIFRGVGRTCRSTRGVVMTLARFDWKRGVVSIGSIGNVEIRVFGKKDIPAIVAKRGIIGTASPTPLIREYPWAERNIMVMYSDGIRTHWSWDDFSRHHGEPATVLARMMLSRLARENDDATLIVVKKNLADGNVK